VSTDNLERDALRGKRAQEWLDDELMQSVFAEIETEQFTAWKNSPARDTEGREKIWQFLAMLARVRSHLQAIADNGKTAEVMLAQENEARRFEKRFGYRPDLGEMRPPDEDQGVGTAIPGAPM
jgi:hypothetical protein